jgi:homoserine O-succinyltransferase
MISPNTSIRIAILDLYEGVANQGMRCLREIIGHYALEHQLNIQITEFDVRLKQEIPDLDFDVYISSGGPGSPIDSKETAWEQQYFNWIENVLQYNQAAQIKKQVFFICHSFQLACRFFNVAEVTKRKSTAFGVFPVHYLESVNEELVFAGLKDPFYTVDSRDYQVIQPKLDRLQSLGAKILVIEKARPHVPYERAIMAIRFNENMIGTQFHPEADALGMLQYLQSEEKKLQVIENHGEAKWQSMVEQLNDPDKIMYTYAHVLPNFLNLAIRNDAFISSKQHQHGKATPSTI